MQKPWESRLLGCWRTRSPHRCETLRRQTEKEPHGSECSFYQVEVVPTPTKTLTEINSVATIIRIRKPRQG